VEKENRRGVPVQGGHPAPEDDPEAHGRQHLVHPLQADPVIGVEKIEAKKKPRPLPGRQEIRHRGDSGGALEDGAALHPAKLVGGDDRREEREQPVDDHLGQQLVIGAEEGDGPELVRRRDAGDLGKKADHTPPHGRRQAAILEHGVAGIEQGRAHQGEGGAVELVRDPVQAGRLGSRRRHNRRLELRKGERALQFLCRLGGKGREAIQQPREEETVR